MSVLILARRFGAEPRHITMRGFELVIGADRFGRLSDNEVERPFFTISRQATAYSLTINDPAFSRNSKSATTELTQELLVTGEDFKFYFYLVGAYQELLAFSEIDPGTLAGPFSAQISLGPGQLLTPLPRDGKFSVGSAIDAGIHLPLSVVPAIALEVHCRAEGLEIVRTGQSFQINHSQSIALGPAGLAVEILRN